MSKKILILMLLAGGSFVACSESTQDDRNFNSSDTISPDVENNRNPAITDTVGRDTAGQDPMRHTGTIDGDTVVMPRGTGDTLRPREIDTNN